MELPLPELTAELRSRVGALGFELVDLKTRGSPKRVSLQVRIDRPDSEPGRGITIAECAAASRALEEWLDRSEILGRRYRLEVSSPGIERPVRWREHWERFRGRQVRVRIEGRGRITATIVRVLDGEDAVVLRPVEDVAEFTVPLDEARDATLVVDWSEIDRSTSRRGG
jgi:ribosome maturation factor RimP